MEGCDQGSKHALSRNRKEKGSRKFLDNMIEIITIAIRNIYKNNTRIRKVKRR